MEKRTVSENVKPFTRVDNYLNGINIYLSEEELKNLLDLIQLKDDYDSNVGFRSYRINSNEREKAFQEMWFEENYPVAGVNHGYGILQDLFIERPLNALAGSKCVEVITSRDRMIVATVIQWLGSNCGMAFIESAFNKFGAYVGYEENRKRDVEYLTRLKEEKDDLAAKNKSAQETIDNQNIKIEQITKELERLNAMLNK